VSRKEGKRCDEAHGPPEAPVTAVLVAADVPSSGVIREVRADRLAAEGGTGGQEVTAFIDRLARGLRGHRAVLMLYPSWRPEPTERLIRLARGVLRTDRIAAVPLDLPPLALSLIADQLAYMARHVAPGVLAGLAHRLAAEAVAGAWVSSVARLEHIETGLGPHLSSYLPGSAFMVTVGARAGVHRITGDAPVAQLGTRPMDPVVVLASVGDADPAWLHTAFKPHIAAAVVTLVAPQPLSQDYWGTRKYVEFVAFSGHPGALSRAARAAKGRPCRWCGETTALAVCAFCSMVQPPSARRPPPRPVAPAPAQRHRTAGPAQDPRAAEQARDPRAAGLAQEPGPARRSQPVQPARRPQPAQRAQPVRPAQPVQRAQPAQSARSSRGEQRRAPQPRISEPQPVRPT
jgi:hypothetical protein